MSKNIFRTIGAVAILAGTSTASPSFALTYEDAPYRDVVRDYRGQVVRSIAFGNCVRTKWPAPGGVDPCGVQMVETIVTPQRLSVDQRTVYFDFDKADLRTDARQRLDNLATVLSASSDVRHADIVGFADRIGNTQYNEALSIRRAQAVRDYLARQGYVNTQIAATRGLGETRPRANCDGITQRSALIACLQPDRRVEVEIQYMDAPTGFHPTSHPIRR